MTVDLDIPALTSPFSEGPRGGVDLREDDDPNNAYRRIRDARNEAREEERQSDLNGESQVAARSLWRDVWENGQHYLQNNAKDLEIVAYMIEASIRLYGYRGFAASLNLTRELLTSFWGELLPTPDEEGLITTLRPVSRLNGDVISYPLMRVPMTDDTSTGQFVVWQYNQAKQLENLSSEERDTRISSGAVTLERFHRAVAETSDGFYRDLQAQIQEARQALGSLTSALEERVSDAEMPNLSRFSASLQEAESVLQQIAGPRLVVKTESVSGGDGGTTTTGGPGGGSSGPSAGPLSTRSDALELLETVARWFETHEPQSLLPSEIRKAIRRGRMTPEELYVDLIADSDARRQLYKDVGMKMPEND
jgi:type VI secretion system protein ImpA